MPKDEAYILDICDSVLGVRSLRQHRFDFLRGDRGHRLPVDAFYPSLSLVIEYHEQQHTRPVPIMDRRPTVSGVPRGKQRRIYDLRRREVLPANGIELAILDYSLFANRRGRLLRIPDEDREVVRRELERAPK